MKRSPILVFLALVTLSSWQSHAATPGTADLLDPANTTVSESVKAALRDPRVGPLVSAQYVEAPSSGATIVADLIAHTAHNATLTTDVGAALGAYLLTHIAWDCTMSKLLPKFMRHMQCAPGVVRGTTYLRRLYTRHPWKSFAVRYGMAIAATNHVAPYAVQPLASALNHLSATPRFMIGGAFGFTYIGYLLGKVIFFEAGSSPTNPLNNFECHTQDLRDAVRDGNLAKVQEFFADPTVEERTLNNWQLITSIPHDHPNTDALFARFFDSASFDINDVNEEGTLLHHLVSRAPTTQGQCRDRIQRVLNHPCFEAITLNATDWRRNNALQSAVLNDNEEAFTTLFAHPRSPAVDATDERYNTLLHRLAQQDGYNVYAHPGVAAYLNLMSPQDLIKVFKARNYDYRTAVEHARYWGNQSLMSLLISYGADVYRPYRAEPCIHSFARGHMLPRDVEAAQRNLRWILDVARNREILDDVVHVLNDRDETILMHAAQYGYRPLVEMLVSPDVHTDWTLQNVNGHTAQDLARTAGHEELANYLNELGEFAGLPMVKSASAAINNPLC